MKKSIKPKINIIMNNIKQTDNKLLSVISNNNTKYHKLDNKLLCPTIEQNVTNEYVKSLFLLFNIFCIFT